MSMLKPALPTPQQPGLRSFIVYDELPAGCLPFLVETDDVEPHIRCGEYAIVDPTDRDPVAGELFLWQWSSGAHSIVETMQLANWPGWMVGGTKVRELVTLSGKSVGRPIRWMDGPWPESVVEERLIGRVVGIFLHNVPMQYCA